MMKKLLYACALILITSGMSYAQTPTIVGINKSDSCIGGPAMGTSNTVQLSASTSGYVQGQTAAIYWGDGNATLNITVNGGSTPSSGVIWSLHTYTTAGTYTVKFILYDASSNPVDSMNYTLNSFCAALYGIVHKSNDANCDYDYWVDDRINAPVDIEVRKNNVAIDTFTSYGSFYYSVPNPDMVSEFSLHPLLTGSPYNLVCPSTPHKIRLDTLTMTSNDFDIVLDCNPNYSGFDMFAYENALLRPVSYSYIYINAGNVACSPMSGTVTLQISPKFSYSSASPAPASVTGNTVTWNLSNVSSTSYNKLWVSLNPVGTLLVGDTAMNTVSITPTTGDNDITNNVYVGIDSIRASFDPNDKSVEPGGNIVAGEQMTYNINFENLGNDTAFNIHIIDTISNNLDMSSFQLLQSSHAVGVNMVDAGNGTTIVRFDFANIRLADKTHPESNKGYVRYRINALSSLMPGDQIKNTAHIYFDINPAVVTNTVVSSVAIPTNIQNVVASSHLSLYPNPANDILYIGNETGMYNHVSIVNAVGQHIMQQHIEKGNNSIDVSSLADGLYYITAAGKEGNITMKFMIQ